MLHIRSPYMQGRAPNRDYDWLRRSGLPSGATRSMARGTAVDRSSPYPKRRLVDSLVSQTTISDLTAAVDAFDEATLRKVLLDITTTNLSTAHFVFEALEEQKHVVASLILEFDQHVRGVVYTLRKNDAIYRTSYKLPGEKAEIYREETCDLIDNAVDVVRGATSKIVASTTLQSHFDTKKGALDALWKIGTTIGSTSTNHIARNVQTNIGQRSNTLEEAVRHVLGCMSYSEMMQVASANGGEVFAKFDELVRVSNRERIFKELPDAVVQLFQYKPAAYSHLFDPAREDLEVDVKENGNWDSDDDWCYDD